MLINFPYLLNIYLLKMSVCSWKIGREQNTNIVANIRVTSWSSHSLGIVRVEVRSSFPKKHSRREVIYPKIENKSFLVTCLKIYTWYFFPFHYKNQVCLKMIVMRDLFKNERLFLKWNGGPRILFRTTLPLGFLCFCKHLPLQPHCLVTADWLLLKMMSLIGGREWGICSDMIVFSCF